MRSSRIVYGLAMVGLGGLVLLGLQASEAPDRDTRPNGKGIGTLQHPPTTEQAANPEAKGGGHGGGGGGGGKPKSNGINYHGGAVMSNQIHMYYIWYGDWTGNTAAEILEDFADNIGGSPYFKINATYFDDLNTKVSTDVVRGAAVSTGYPYGTSLSDSTIRQIVADAITSGSLPLDRDGVYFVLTSADVTASSGFCTLYCGWHTATTMTVNGYTEPIKYSFIGNPERCLSACAAQPNGPNDNPGADAMASIIAHELEEAATDPELNAWYDRRGYENADKCAWSFGDVYSRPNGTFANMQLGTRHYLIQRNWVNANGGYCALSY